MDNLHSTLKPRCNYIENSTELSPPLVICRSFSNREHRDNFLKGFLWLCGPSQNRFFRPKTESGEEQSDIFEYRNQIASFLFEYSMSFSTEIINPNLPSIIITDINGFICTIIECLKNQNLTHQVSWLCKQTLEQYIQTVPAITTIKTYPTRENEIVLLDIVSVGGSTLQYVDKQISSIVNGKYDSVAVAQNAKNKNIAFKKEKEFRIAINTSDFLGNYSGNCLFHLVQYLKLRCPDIGKYCTAIN